MRLFGLFAQSAVLHVLLFAALAVAVAEDYYKILEIDKSASEREIKKAYRSLSKKFHPDKNPGSESAHDNFVKVSEAYEVLSDAKQRDIYDRYGHDGIKNFKQGHDSGRSHDPFDIFRQFFGTGPREQRLRTSDKLVRINVPLHVLATGAKDDIQIERQKVCDDCLGKGYDTSRRESEAMVICPDCGGHGIITQKVMLMPGMYQQVQQQCNRCAGEGRSIKIKCPKCKGKRVHRDKESLHVEILPGTPIGWQMQFSGFSDERPDAETGDVIIEVSTDENEPGYSIIELQPGQMKTAWYKYGDTDLRSVVELPIDEALLGGWSRMLQKLDGSSITISKRAGETVQSGQVDKIQNEGLPTWDSSIGSTGKRFGSALIEYKIKLPKRTDNNVFQKNIRAAFAALGQTKDEL